MVKSRNIATGYHALCVEGNNMAIGYNALYY